MGRLANLGVGLVVGLTTAEELYESWSSLLTVPSQRNPPETSGPVGPEVREHRLCLNSEPYEGVKVLTARNYCSPVLSQDGEISSPRVRTSQST